MGLRDSEAVLIRYAWASMEFRLLRARACRVPGLTIEDDQVSLGLGFRVQ